ncbi:heme lyase NrfEFG subunit NrfF [Chelonobacter oris]|nr:heme lyase NrfEFG subunit NrfF [Chelonobacter oris]
MRRYFGMLLWLALSVLFPFEMLQADIVDTYRFQSPETRARAVNLAKSLRCPQCQNQNLVESNSPIAYDLRLEVYKMADEGKSDQLIIERMTARFGDFVRYDPPFKATTLLLWGAPFALLLLAFLLLWRNAGRDKSDIAPQAANALAKPCGVKRKNTVQTRWFGRTLPAGGLCLAIVSSAVLIYCLTPRYAVFQQGAAMPQTVVQSGEEQRRQHRQALQNALTVDHNHGENWYLLGLTYLQDEQYTNALESFSRAEYLLGADSELLAAAATALYYQSNNKLTDKAKAWLDLSLQQNPNQLRALSLLAADAFSRGDYPQAGRYWRQLLDSNHHDLDRRNLIQNLQAAEMLGGMQ